MIDELAYRMIRAFSVILGMVPAATAELLSSVLGRIWFVVDSRHRAVAIKNLTIAFGDAMSGPAIRMLARKNFIFLVSIVFEIGWLVRVKRKNARRLFKFHGLGNLMEARKKGRGALILTAHFGNWELLIMAGGMLGAPMNAVYRPLDFAPLDRFFVNLRRGFGARMYPKKHAAIAVLRSLKNRGLVGILLDQNTNVNDGVFVDFFGKPACTNKGLAIFARATDAPVIPAFLARVGRTFHVEFRPEIPTIKTGDASSDIYANTRNYNRALESMIRRYPEQWFWVHNRWKTRPCNKHRNGEQDEPESPAIYKGH